MFEKFENIAQKTVLVIGDIILDKYIYGDTDRISPEAPVPVVLAHDRKSVLGGAANVARNLTAFGAKVFLVGCIGDDEDGENIKELVGNTIYDTSGLVIIDRKTTAKTRIVSKGQQMLRIDEEDDSNLGVIEEASFLNRVDEIIENNKIDALVFQDYNKGIFTPSVIASLSNKAETLGLPFFVDPKYRNFWEYKGATLFKPNLSELRRANLPLEYDDMAELLAMSAERLSCEVLMCTMAERGIAFVENGSVHFSDTERIDVVDVSGAGDTSLAMMVLGHVLGYSTTDIALLANLCGKVVCMKSGVSTMTLDELKTAYISRYKNND